MTQIAFTYNAQSITLDTSVGELVGNEKVVKQIMDSLYKYIGTTLGGEPWMPFNVLEINEPYKHANEFAICLFYMTNEMDSTFPEELESYLPYHQTIDTDDLMIVY